MGAPASSCGFILAGNVICCYRNSTSSSELLLKMKTNLLPWNTTERKHLFFQNARLHWASPAASQEQMCSLLLAWDAASSQSQFPGYRSALRAAIWWANPRCAWVCFHNTTCSKRLILIPHSKALILTKICKPRVPANKHNPISSPNPSSDSIQALLQLLKCHLQRWQTFQRYSKHSPEKTMRLTWLLQPKLHFIRDGREMSSEHWGPLAGTHQMCWNEKELFLPFFLQVSTLSVHRHSPG